MSILQHETLKKGNNMEYHNIKEVLKIERNQKRKY